MSFRRDARVDANQPEIVKALRRTGWYVLIISQLKNCCDLMISKAGRTIAIEIKDGTRAKSEQKLSPGETTFMNEWQGEYKIIASLDDIGGLNAKERH
jgi:hypothetical protein